MRSATQATPPPIRTPTYIGPSRGTLGIRWRELYAYRELLYFMVWRDVKVRYRHAVLGIAWAVLQPLLTMVVFTIIFGGLVGITSDERPYALFTLAALAPWTYFVTAVTHGANALVGSQHLISKVYFPRLLIPASAVVTPLVDFALALGLLAAALLWYGVAPGPAVLLLPLFALLAVVAALATSLWLSALNVKYRDVRFVLPFAMQFWMFVTPVVYPASKIPDAWRPLYGVNPMATVVEGFRWTLLGTTPSMPMALVSVAVTLLALAGGLLYFRRMEGSFADVL